MEGTLRPHVASPIFVGSDAFVELRPTATVPDVDAGAVVLSVWWALVYKHSRTIDNRNSYDFYEIYCSFFRYSNAFLIIQVESRKRGPSWRC